MQWTKQFETLKEGTEVYYTGDMANAPAWGEIVEVKSDKFNPIVYMIKLDGIERLLRIFPAQFTGPGRRFMLAEEKKAEREKLMAQFN